MQIKLSGLTHPEMPTGTTSVEEDAALREDYNNNLLVTQNAIEEKIKSLDAKLKKFDTKENMLDAIIAGTHVELGALKPEEFTKRGQKQAILIKQLEALSVLHSTIMQYEDMVQKYHKVLMDIQNNKLNAFIKLENLKKEEEKSDDNLSAVLKQIQDAFNAGSANPALPNSTLLAEIEEELKDKNYK